MTTYREMLKRFQLPDLPSRRSTPEILHKVERDIEETGEQGLTTLKSVGIVATLQLEGCTPA